MWLQKAKEDGSSALYVDVSKDEEPATVKFKKGRDDGVSKLHPARFCRAPLAEPDVWWKNMPLKRRPIIRRIPLESLGGADQVSDKTVEAVHDRTRLLKLKHFFAGNLDVQSKAKCRTTVNEDGSLREQVDWDWENPHSLNQAQEALVNYDAVHSNIWPLDRTPNIIWRVLVKYRWISAASSNDQKLKVICQFFENVSRCNATRAVNGQPPASYEKVEKILRQVLISLGVSPEIPYHIPKVGGASNNGPSQGGNSNKKAGPKDKKTERKKAQKDGKGLCFGYNAMDGRKCENTAHADGCKAKDGKQFVHACSQYVPAKGDYCLAAHRRKDHPR